MVQVKFIILLLFCCLNLGSCCPLSKPSAYPRTIKKDVQTQGGISTEKLRIEEE